MISCKELANSVKTEVKTEVDRLYKIHGYRPNLVVIQVGDNPASNSYVNGKIKDCTEVGIEHRVIKLNNTCDAEVVAIIEELNNDTTVDGILVQLPLPGNLNEKLIINSISSSKDVDGFTDINCGKLFKDGITDNSGLYPCTPLGIVKLLEIIEGKDLGGKRVVVIGRSNIVGKPISKMLLDMNGTVTMCHSKTVGLTDIIADADIVICAVGKENFISKEFKVKEDAVIIDVGINRNTEGKLCGDVDYSYFCDKCKYITPVPGGVGLSTRAMLMKNTLKAFKNLNMIQN